MQTIINGIMLGSVYAMVALGLTLIFGILEIPNFAHGALYMVGAFIAFFCISAMGVSYWIALAIAVGALFLLGMALIAWVVTPWFLGAAVRVRPLLLFGFGFEIAALQFVSLGLLGELMARQRSPEEYVVKSRLG